MLFLKSNFTVLVFLASETNILSHDGTFYTHDQSFKQRHFSKHEFHYLNVPRIRTLAVYDVFDCTFECLSNPLCFSVNLAASKGADGKLWCELLPSDKYKTLSQYYKVNHTSHHFAIKVRIDYKNLKIKPFIINNLFFCCKISLASIHK